jgi:hypothetical protein
METNINGKELKKKKKEVRHWWSKLTHLALIKKKSSNLHLFSFIFVSRADDALFTPFFIIIKRETCRILGCYLESSHHYNGQKIGWVFFV